MANLPLLPCSSLPHVAGTHLPLQERTKRDNAEKLRVLSLVDLACKLDPRVKAVKEKERLQKEEDKRKRREAADKEREEEERIRRERQQKEEDEIRKKQEAEDAEKDEKTRQAKAKRKRRNRIRTVPSSFPFLLPLPSPLPSPSPSLSISLSFAHSFALFLPLLHYRQAGKSHNVPEDLVELIVTKLDETELQAFVETLNKVYFPTLLLPFRLIPP